MQASSVDYLRFRTQAEPPAVLEAMRPMFGVLGPHLRFGAHSRGRDGFQRRLEVLIGDGKLAELDFGGDSQRGWVRVVMSGDGCRWVQDWDGVEALEELPRAEIRRLDLQVTTWRGEVTHERVVRAYEAGKFSCGGRPPALQQIVSSDPTAGRTCSVGKRGSDKFFRGYEKGFEMARTRPGLESVNDCPLADIYRCEVEFQADTRPVPWDCIFRRDQYYAGAYPFCAELLPQVEPDLLAGRPERMARLELQAALANIRQQYGSTLFTALTAYQGDIGAVWERIVGDRHSERLLEAGVLMFEHDH